MTWKRLAESDCHGVKEDGLAAHAAGEFECRDGLFRVICGVTSAGDR